MPRGLAIWERLAQHLHDHGLVPFLDHGIAVMLVPRQATVLAPLPDADYSFLVAIRPRIPLRKYSATCRVCASFLLWRSRKAAACT